MRRQMMDEILASNYPVRQWSRVMTELGQNPGCSELFDMDIALMHENEHLNGGHVELGLEHPLSIWQPRRSRTFMKTKEPALSARVQYSSGVRAEGILREWSQS